MGFRTKAAAAVCTICVAASGFVFSTRSLDNLSEVDQRLQIVADCALSKSSVDFVVIDGGRTAAEHASNLANGTSWIKRSKHQDGLAIDIAAYVDGQITYAPEPYYKINQAFTYCSALHNVPLTWGGTWRARDLMHFELR
jgi:peptidoglycan L-alanyl-D-glutamate endopeptidase CwlK